MQVDKELCLKFPVVLRNKLLNKEIELPDTTQFKYEKLFTYRAVERNEDDYREVTLEDFKSSLLWSFQFPEKRNCRTEDEIS